MSTFRIRLEESVEMAILDPLTGLHYRRYTTSHLATLFDDASRRGKPLSLLLIDIDAGDAVLREFATRIRRDTRGIDLACRLGGEEFVVVMPDCDLTKGYEVGERLRQCIEAVPFEVGRSACCRSRRASGSRRSNLRTTRLSTC